MLHFVDASSILGRYAFFRLAALCSPLDFPFHTRLRIFLIRRNGSRPQITAGSRTTAHGTNVDLSVSCADRRAAHVPCGEQTGSIGCRGVKAACRHPPFHSGHLQRQFFQIASRPDLQVWPALFMRKTAAETASLFFNRPVQIVVFCRNAPQSLTNYVIFCILSIAPLEQFSYCVTDWLSQEKGKG